MPSNYLSGQTPEMDRGATVAHTIVANLNAHETKLRPTVEAARSHWRGTALPVFEAKHQEWQLALAQFRAKLQALGDVTRTSSIKYVAANDESTATVASVQAGAAFKGALGGPATA